MRGQRTALLAAPMLASSAAAAPVLERKDAPEPTNAEIKSVLDQLGQTFSEFKQANDDRLKNLEKGRGDGLDEVKTDKVNEEITRLTDEVKQLRLDAKRAPVGEKTRDGVELSEAEVKHRDTFRDYMRKGTEAPDRWEIAQKALSVGVDPNGGYLAPLEVDRNIDRIVSEVSAIRGLATVRQIGGAGLKKALNVGGATSGWVGETEERPETDTPTLKELEFNAMELYAKPKATQTMLDDAYIDIEAWLADEVQIEFSEQEGKAFVSGNGIKKPKGIFAYDKVAATKDYVHGKIAYHATGAANGFKATAADANPGDVLIDLIYGLKATYRQNGRFLMNRATQAMVRKFKDTEGNYIWQPGLQNSQPASLLGYGIAEAEDVADVEAGAFPIAFGDFRRGYLIVDRIGVRVLRDPYSSKPWIEFYTTKRVGGGVQNFEAFRLLKVGAN